MAEPLLQVQDLRVEFPARRGPRVAVDAVSFDIAPGEVLGVVGESGAGKSVTGAAVIGLLDAPGRITAGRILFDGRRIDDLPRAELRRLRGRQIGSIFQDPLTALNPLFTVGDQIVETMRAHLPLGRREARQRAIDLLAATGVPSAAQRFDQYPHQFSGGMRQRVVIALALAGEPRLVVADEPTTALDVSTQAQVLAVLRRLCRDHGTAVMLITHDLGVVAETCGRVAVMYAGRLVEIGPVAEVLDAPAHPYTRGLLDAVPTLAGERERLPQIEGTMPAPDALPAGCAFHPRCPRRMARCSVERPPLLAAGERRVACWLHVPEGPA